MTDDAMLDCPLTSRTVLCQPCVRKRDAVLFANLPSLVSAADIWSACRLRCRSCCDASPGQGGAPGGQGGAVGVGDSPPAPPWPASQAEPGAGACKCSRTYARSRPRSAGEANGACVMRRPQFGKHAERVHHATQNSCPASFNGGRWVRITARAPPGRRGMLDNSVSTVGFAIRATGATAPVSVVSAETLVRPDVMELAAVLATEGLRLFAPPGATTGSRYVSGISIQLVER